MKKNIALKLSLLNYLETHFNVKKKKPFEGYVCVFIQHLLGSNISLIKSLEKCGIEKKNLYIIGKAYSSSIDALNYLENHNYNYINPQKGYSINVCYDEILKKEIRKIFKIVFSQHENLPILLLDDAGKGICVAHELEFKKNISRFKCVELTTRGINALKEINLCCPVINIGTSRVKKEIEAPLIAKSMVIEFLKLIKKWNRSCIPRNNKVLLIGYGTIGKLVSENLLSKGFEIVVFDINTDQRKLAETNGFAVSRDVSNEIDCGIVIGCTGTTSIDYKTFKNFHDGTFFINMASSDLEFGLWRYKGRKYVVNRHEKEYLKLKPWQCLYKIVVRGTLFFILKGGFPVNFTGAIDPISASEIQITRALVLAGALQVVNLESNGLIPLDIHIQEKLHILYQQKKKNDFK